GYERVGFLIGDRVFWVGCTGSGMSNTGYEDDKRLAETVVARWNAGERAAPHLGNWPSDQVLIEGPDGMPKFVPVEGNVGGPWVPPKDVRHVVTVSLSADKPASCSCGETFWPNEPAISMIRCPRENPH